MCQAEEQNLQRPQGREDKCEWSLVSEGGREEGSENQGLTGGGPVTYCPLLRIKGDSLKKYPR